MTAAKQFPLLPCLLLVVSLALSACAGVEAAPAAPGGSAVQGAAKAGLEEPPPAAATPAEPSLPEEPGPALPPEPGPVPGVEAVPVEPVPVEPEPTERQGVTATVDKVSYHGNVTVDRLDPQQLEQLLSYVDALTEAALDAAPDPGGGVYLVSVARDGFVHKYSFTNQEAGDGQLLVQNLADPQTWWLTEQAALDYLESLF